MQILIIGGSYGSADSKTKLSEEDKKNPYKVFNSITKTEFEIAHKRRIPIYFFVENSVLNEYNTYKKNRDNTTIKYAHVSSVNIFALLDEIYSLQSGNFIQGFTKFEDISSWLKLQWAHLMAEFISNRTEQLELENLNNSVEKLNSITSSLKAYTEQILKKVEPENFERIKNDQEEISKENIVRIIQKHPLIRFIKKYNKVINNELVYVNLSLSSTLDEFLSKVLTPEDYQEIMGGSLRIDEMTKDFYVLKGLIGKE